MPNSDVKIRILVENNQLAAAVSSVQADFAKIAESIGATQSEFGKLEVTVSKFRAALAQTAPAVTAAQAELNPLVNTVGTKLPQGVDAASQSVQRFSSSVSTNIHSASGSMGEMVSASHEVAASLEQLKHYAELYLGFEAIKHFAEGLVHTQIEMQQIKFGLQAAAGSASGADREFSNLEQASNKLGASLKTMSETYGTFLVSAKSAHVPLSDAHDLFQSVNEAVTVFHLDTGKAHSALLALEQMMAQGVIRSQELRLQLGQAIPGAYENFMNAVNKSGVNFRDALEKGKLDVKTYGKVLADAIRGSFTEGDLEEASNGLNAQLNRMQNQIFEFKRNLSGGLFEKVATETVIQLGNIVEAFNTSIGPSSATVVTIGGMGALLVAMGQGARLASEKISEGIPALLKATGLTAAAKKEELELAEAKVVGLKAQQAQTAAQVADIEVKRVQLAQTIATKDTEIAAMEAKIASARAAGVADAALVKNNMALVRLQAERSASQLRLNVLTGEATQLVRAQALVTGELAVAEEAAGAAATQMAAETSIASTAMGGLKAGFSGLMTLIGGFPGMLALAAAGILYFISQETEAEEKLEGLHKAYDDLNKATEENIALSIKAAQARLTGIDDEISKTKQAIEDEKAQLDKLHNSSLGRRLNPLTSAIDSAKAAEIYAQLQLHEHDLEALKMHAQETRDLIDERSSDSDAFNRRQAPLKAMSELDAKVEEAGKHAEELNKRIHEANNKPIELIKQEQVATLAAYRVQFEALMASKIFTNPERQKAEKDFQAKIDEANAKFQQEIDAQKKLDDIEAEKRRAAARKKWLEEQRVALKNLAKDMSDVDKALASTRAAFKESDPVLQKYNDTLTKLSDMEKKAKDDIFAAAAARQISFTQQADDLTKLSAAMDEARKNARLLYEDEENQRRAQAQQNLSAFESKLFGTDDSNATRRLNTLAEFKRLATGAGLKEGTDAYNAELAKVNAALDALEKKSEKANDGFSRFVQGAAQNVQGFLSSSLMQLFENTFDANKYKNVFESIADGFGKMLKRMAAELAASQVMSALQSIAGLVIAGLGGGGLQTASSVDTGAASSYISGLQNGGVIGGLRYTPSAPTMASLVGPTPGNTQVNITNTTGQPATANKTKTSDGREIIEVVVGEVAKSIRNNGSVGQAIQGTFGTKRQGTSRG